MSTKKGQEAKSETPHHNGQINDRNERHNDDQQQNQLMLLHKDMT